MRAWLAGGADGATHQGFPVIDDAGTRVGVVTRRDLTADGHADATTMRSVVHRSPIVIHEDNTLREAADQMVRGKVGRLPVVTRQAPHPGGGQSAD